MNEDAFCFGTMRLHRQARLLLDGGQPVRLGGRALDLLIVLVERAPAVVSRAELESRVWPHGAIDDSSLRVQVATLRRCLGERDGHRFVANVPGRGYSFVAPVSREPVHREPARQALAAQPLPVRLVPVVGRDEVIARLVQWLDSERLVTVVGAGGVGKSTVAIAAAAAFARQRREVVLTYLDLASAADPAPWPAAEAALLVLDSCELHVQTVAERVLDWLKAAPQRRVLATSREPLRVEGERVLRLGPLPLPPQDPLPSLAGARDWPALALLLDRLRAQLDDFALDAGQLAAAVALCHRVEGLPLGLELAAAQVPFFGLQGLLDRLQGGLGWLASRDRSVAERHRSWRASLEWSWRTLAPAAQRSLARLSVFPGSFDVQEAIALTPANEPGAADGMVEHLVDGVAKSLLVKLPGGETLRYRLAVGLREQAAEALAGGDEAGSAAAAWVRLRLTRWQHTGWDGTGDALGELQAVLDWACSPAGDALAGAQALLLAAPAALRLPHPERFAAGVARLRRHIAGEDGDAAPHRRPWSARLELLAALLHAAGVGLDSLAATDGGVAAAVERLRAFDATDATETTPTGARLVAAAAAESWHRQGRFDEATAGARAALDLPADARVPELLDARAAMAALQARTLWIQGQAARSLKALQAALARAEAASAVDLCRTLAEAACPIALWRGDLVQARQATARLRLLADRHALPHWQGWADRFEAVLAGGPVPTAGETLDVLDLLATLQPAAVTPAQLERALNGRAGWCAAELLRASGEAMLAGPDPDRLARARARFVDAAALARRQGSLAWELRATLSAARLDRGDSAVRPDSLDRLAQVVARLPDDGVETVDRTSAMAMLGSTPLRAPAAKRRTARVAAAAPRHESSR